jgi:hypothetical protein
MPENRNAVTLAADLLAISPVSDWERIELLAAEAATIQLA